MRAAFVSDPALESFAAEVGATGPVAVIGGRTRWDRGGALHPGARTLPAPEGLVDYRPEEMIVRVRAGTRVADLHGALAEKGQRTALPERDGTVGGAVSVGENHVEVLGRGRVRDSVLQMRYVAHDGSVVTCGGAVVKNVSGFNLPKLMVGALGTLGLVAEVVLRTNPIPAARVWLRAEGASPATVHDLLFHPSAILVEEQRTWVLLEGHEADVVAERRRLEAMARVEEVEGPPTLPPHRWSMRPGDLAAVDASETGGHVAAIGVGTLWAERPQPAVVPDPAAERVRLRAKSLFDPSGRLNPGRRPGSSG